MADYIPNSKCRSAVQSCTPFKGSNLWGEWEWADNKSMRQYVVYSYGPHFPLYINSGGMWFENSDRYSRTTSRHLSLARPTDKTILLTTQGMITLLINGWEHLVKQRILTGEQYGRRG
jgi:hypothetical protein